MSPCCGYLSPDTVVAHLVSRCPETLPVFQRFGIDCHGSNGTPLGQVCRERELPYAALALALTAALASRTDTATGPPAR